MIENYLSYHLSIEIILYMAIQAIVVYGGYN